MLSTNHLIPKYLTFISQAFQTFSVDIFQNKSLELSVACSDLDLASINSILDSIPDQSSKHQIINQIHHENDYEFTPLSVLLKAITDTTAMQPHIPSTYASTVDLFLGVGPPKLNFINNDGESILYLLSALGADSVVKDLFSQGVVSDLDDPFRSSQYGVSPLFAAVEGNHTKTVEELLRWGANVNTFRFDGCTPLHFAIQAQNFDIIKNLVNSKADVNQPVIDLQLDDSKSNETDSLISEKLESLDDESDLEYGGGEAIGMTPIHLASHTNNLEIFKFLLNNNANLNSKIASDGRNVLHAAIMSHSFKIIDYLCELSVTGKLPFSIDDQTDQGLTPLLTSIGLEDSQVTNKLFHQLIQAGADPLFIAQDGMSPLIASTITNNEFLVKELIEKFNVNTNLGLVDNMTRPIDIACQMGHSNILKLLLPLVEDPNYSNDAFGGFTCLHRAVYFDTLDCVNQLISDSRINVNQQTTGIQENIPPGSSSLHIALRCGHDSIIKTLLSHNNIDITVCDSLGHIPDPSLYSGSNKSDIFGLYSQL